MRRRGVLLMLPLLLLRRGQDRLRCVVVAASAALREDDAEAVGVHSHIWRESLRHDCGRHGAHSGKGKLAEGLLLGKSLFTLGFERRADLALHVSCQSVTPSKLLLAARVSNAHWLYRC